MKQAKWFAAPFCSFSRRSIIPNPCNSRYRDDYGRRITNEELGISPASSAGIGNFYFAQLEEIERFGLTTLYVDFGNLQDFTVNGETGVLAQAIAQQYYR